jgi:hypothetical protein
VNSKGRARGDGEVMVRVRTVEKEGSQKGRERAGEMVRKAGSRE